MKQYRKPLLITALTLLLILSGASWYIGQCVLPMHGPASAPAAAQAAGTKYTCGMHPMIITDKPGTCPICGMELTPLKTDTGGGSKSGGNDSAKPQGERKIKYWVAPMDPTYIRDKPGKSPMGMDLVPVYEDEAPGGSVITIDPVTIQDMGVRTALATRMDMARTVRTVGLVAYQEPKQYAVNTKIDGWIETLYVNELGQRVKKGQRLLDIYSPDLVSAQEEYLLALKNHDTLVSSPFPQIADSGRQLLEASRRRLQLWDISSAQISRLEKTRKVEKNLTLYAPENGIVSMKTALQGQYVKKGMELMTISDISKVWVMADIYEYELPWAKVGEQADIILPFVGSKKVTGTLSYIYPFVEPKTRTVKARFDLDNADFELKPDMYVNVHLKTSPVKNVLAVPADAVLRSGERETVFIALGNGKFEPRQVKTGLQDDKGNLQIVQGLLDGDRVVTSAQFMLDSESNLREAIAKMLEPKAPAEQKPAMKMDNMPNPAKTKSDDDLNDLFK